MEKFKSKAILSLILTIILVVSIFGNSVLAASKTLSITGEEQEETNWCWAACALMNGQYVLYNSGIMGPFPWRTQTILVIEVKGSNGNYTGSVADTEEASEYAGCNYFGATGAQNSPLSYSSVKSYINDEEPIIAGLLATTGGHMVLIKGYKDQFLLWGDRVVYNDPANGNSYTKNYNDFYSNSNWYWDGTIKWN